MTEAITLIGLGIIFLVIGMFNFMGRIGTIHWYHRTRITEETRKPYGRFMGSAKIIIALGLLIPGLLMLFMDNKNFEVISIVALIVGLVLIVYAQFKYNKGIF